MRCRHQWQFVSATFTRGATSLEAGPYIDEDLALQLAFGITTLAQRCAKCGWVETAICPGRVVVEVTR